MTELEKMAEDQERLKIHVTDHLYVRKKKAKKAKKKAKACNVRTKI